MLRTISSDQLDEWIAYSRIEPFGLAALDYLFADLKRIMVMMVSKKNRKLMDIKRYLLFFGEKGEAKNKPGNRQQ